MDKSIVISPFKSTILKIKNEINSLNDIVSFSSGGHSLEINYGNASKGNAVKSLSIGIFASVTLSISTASVYP